MLFHIHQFIRISESLNLLHKIPEILPKEDDEIVVIGQSFGGLICRNHSN